MPSVTVTTASPDRRLAKPADLVARDSSISTAEARRLIDRASARAVTAEGLGFDPWRQTYTLRCFGTDTGFLKLYSKPVYSVTSIADVAGSTYTDTRIGSNGIGIRDRIERNAGFPRAFNGSLGTSAEPWAESEKDDWILTGAVCGWLMPGQVGQWSASAAYKATIGSTSYDDASGSAYAAGSWVRSYNPAIQLRFECTTAGTSDSSEPAGFQTASSGDEITDGTVTWTARDAEELPADIEEGALLLALMMYQQQDRELSVKSERDGEGGRTYLDKVPEPVACLWRPYR